MRAMTSSSVTRRSEQELAIAFAAGDRRRDDAGDLPTERSHALGDVIAHTGLNLRVPHDPLLEVPAPRLELRLDQRDEVGRCPSQCQRGRQYQLERHED